MSKEFEMLKFFKKYLLSFSKLFAFSFWFFFFIASALWSYFSGRFDKEKYIFASLIFCSALLLVLLLPRKLKDFVLISLFLVIPIYYLLLPTPGYKIAQNFDRRSKLEVIGDLRKKGEDAWPFVHPSYFSREIEVDGEKILPLSSISKKLTVLCNENGYWVKYFSDRFGFRNSDELWDEKVDVVVVGDSFAQGWCVEDGKTIVDVIVRETGLRILNLAMAGNEMLRELATLREYVSELSPKVVLWMYAEANDLVGTLNVSKSPVRKYLNENFKQNLMEKQDKVDKAIVRIVKVLEERIITRKAGTLWSATRFFEEFYNLKGVREIMRLFENPQPPESSLKLARQILQLAKHEVESWGGKLVFIYLPDWHRWAVPEYLPFYSYTKNHRKYFDMIKVVKELDIPLIDLVPVFESYQDPLTFFPFRLFGHYNEAGQLLVGKKIAEKLNEILN